MELAKHADLLRARGLGICSISYDPVEVLRDFAQRRGITYPMLADPGSVLIRRFGLFNETISPGDRAYGVPHPVLFFVDPSGVVTRKYAEEKYFHRRTMATILAEGDPTAGIAMGEAERGEYVTVQPIALQREVYPGNRFALFVDVTPRSGVHIYAPGAGSEYRPLTLRVKEQPYFITFPPTYPVADQTWKSPEDEDVPVYTSTTRVRVEVALTNRQDLKPVYDAGGTIRVEGTLGLQACDEIVCWAPIEIPVVWSMRLIPPDLERPPESLQRERLALKPTSPS